MKQLLIKIGKTTKRIVFITLSIGISLGIILFFRWLGFKGLLGFIVGVMLTGFMFMTDNIYVKVFMNYILKEK